MKNSIIINRMNRTLSITKAFNTKASVYDSDEYKDLTAALKDNPGFRLIVINTTSKKTPLGRITYKQIESYIKSHDDENESIYKEYKKLRGIKDDDADDENNENELEVKIAPTYFEVKKWFTSKFPELTKEAVDRRKEINNIIKNAAKKEAC